MGDGGSTWLAFMIFALALLSIQAAWLSYATWLILAALFVTDGTVTLLTRIARGERWYEAHRSHVYQKLAPTPGEHKRVTCLACGINMGWLAPLAGACTLWPQGVWGCGAWGWVALAYTPLVVGAWMLGAGRTEA
jgi:Fuc2NAc and GlcNAc transferase